MITVNKIETDEIVRRLDRLGIKCDEIWFPRNKWSYAGGFLEGESKWALLYYANGESEYADKAYVEFQTFVKKEGSAEVKCLTPHVAIEHLVCRGNLPKGEYLIWREW
jgi:hypothetical protein